MIMIDKNTVIWALIDDKPGHESQVLGVAEALGLPYLKKRLSYTPSANWPNILKRSLLQGVNAEKSDPLTAPWPDIVIGAGRKTAPIARWIKKQAKKEGRSCFLLQLMWPGRPTRDFDLIAVPEHDHIPASPPKVINMLGAPHRVTEGSLQREGAMWEKTLNRPDSPVIALLVGGNAGKRHFTPAHATALGQQVSAIAHHHNAAVWLTTSRRTPEQVTAALKQSLTCPHYFHDIHQGRANPYYAFLALSDVVIVTGDSISMCSEACASGKPVYIYAPEGITPKKHQRLHQSLYAQGYAAPLDEKSLQNRPELVKNEGIERPRLQAAREIAAALRERWKDE